MLHVEVKNFQSIEHVSLQIDRFTALVGRSNLGKSALVRAIKAALTGATGTAFVRHGDTCARRLKGLKTCKCVSSVHLRKEGFDLFWEKGDGGAKYIFNGVEYSAVDRGVPEFLQPDFSLIKVGQGQQSLQVASQFDPIFLLGESGNVIANVISDVANLDRLNQAMQLVEKDRKEAASTRKVREKDVLDLQSKLSGYKGLDSEVKNVNELDERLRQIHQCRQTAQRAQGWIDDIMSIGTSLKKLHKVTSVTLPEPDTFQETVRRYGMAFQLAVKLKDRGQEASKLAFVQKVTIPEVDEITTLARRWKTVETLLPKYEARSRDVMSLDGVQSIIVPELTAKDALDKALRVVSWQKRLKPIADRMRKAIQATKLDVPETQELLSRYETLDKVSQFERKYQALQGTMERLQLDLDEANAQEEAINAEIKALGVCVVCSRPFGEH